jgi:GMP synthase (glutamine-hydrolysing)
MIQNSSRKLTMRQALVINHIAFEDLGSLGKVLVDAGFNLKLINAATCDWAELEPQTPDLLVILGGPIGVYEQQAYPFLVPETAFIAQRLSMQRPTIGICLGAQLMAAACNMPVYPGKAGKEIGWSTLMPGKDLAEYPLLAPLVSNTLPVLHWHGDTFDLPEQARHLAGSERYANQIYALGNYALGFQCHLEVTATGLESWYIGHACELAHANIDVALLRQQSVENTKQLATVCETFWKKWLQQTFGE